MASLFQCSSGSVAVTVQRASAVAAAAGASIKRVPRRQRLDAPHVTQVALPPNPDRCFAGHRAAAATAFLTVDTAVDEGWHAASCGVRAPSKTTSLGFQSRCRVAHVRGDGTTVVRERRQDATCFEGETGSQKAPSGDFQDEDVDTCYNKRGQVCNKSEIGIDPHLQAKLDTQNDQLRMMMHHGFCNDPKFESEEECTKEGGEWHELEGPRLQDEISIASSLARSTRKTVENEAARYRHAFDELDAAYKDFKKEVTVWQQAISGLEDDYALHCRPFHDVTMQCEAKFRQALRWWFAREPLPACEVGVVTPYLRNKTRGAFSFILTELC